MTGGGDDGTDRDQSGLFVGDSEMATLIRAKDWSGTPMGPIREWPQHLRTAMGIMLESRHPMLMWWGPGFVQFYNDAFMEIAGSKHPDGLGRHGWEMFADVWPTVGPMLAGVLSTGEATWVDDQMLMMDRRGHEEETYWTYSYSPVRAPDGTVEGVFTATTDTTRRVLGERRLRTLRELGEIGTVVAPTVEDVCAGALRVLGGNRADVPYALAYVLAPDAASARLVDSLGVRAGHPAVPALLPDPSADPAVWAAVSAGEAAVVPAIAPGALLRGAGTVGTEPPEQAMALPLVVAGELRGLLLAGVSRYRALDAEYRSFFDLVAGQVSTVIADVEAYQAEVRRAEALAELDRAKTEFFTNISHEFRTPLTLIMGPLAELRATPAVAADPAARENAEVVHRNGQRLARLVDSLLDFSRIQAGRMQASYEPVDFAACTAELAGLFQSAVEQAGLVLDVDCPPLDEQVHLDRGMWEKVVLNLLSNALKFTFEGRIAVRVRAGEDGAVLRVSDTGTGVAPADLPRLFDRFYRGGHGRARSVEGSGVGLALVRELVGLHGGTITADSLVDVGTTFTVTLPFGTAHLPADRLVPAAERAAPSRHSEPYVAEALRLLPPQDRGAAPAQPAAGAPRGPDADAAPGFSGGRVLVADDNADMREYLHRLLSPHYEVQSVADGRAALAAARELPPDLVVSDVMMPELDGLALVTALRQEPETAQVPVLLLSARAGQEASVEGLHVGADDYLVKPFSAAELLARVRSNLQLARLRSHESSWRATLIGALQDGMFVTDPNGVVVEVNDAFADIVGYGPAGLPYSAPHPWWPEPETEPDEFAQVRNVLETALRSRPEGRTVLPARHGADGRRIWLSVSWGTVLEPDGARQALVGTVRDVTAEHLAAHRDAVVAAMTARLAEASDVQGVLNAGLAELGVHWPLRRAMVVTWESPDEVSVFGAHTSWAQLPASTRAVIDRIRDSGRVSWQRGDDSVDRPSVAGAPIKAGNRTGVVWLELGPGRSFDADEAALLLDLAGHLGQALTRAALFDEQRTASLTLQRAILGPTVLPAGFAVRYEPAVSHLAVGGDWYDVVELEDDRVGVAVGDCVGRGLEAAAVMGQLRTACRTLLLEGHSAAQVLTAMDHVAALNPDAICTTLFCAVIDRSAGTVSYSRAGHPPAIVARAHSRTEVLDGARSVPLATLPVQRPEATTVLDPGDTVLLYTDGLVERREQAVDGGIARVRRLLASAGQLAPARIADRLAEQLLGDGHDDDVAYLVYQHELRTGSTVSTTLPARPEQLAALRNTLRRWLAASGVPQQMIHELVLAVGEAAANAVEHAYLDAEPGSIELTLSRHPGELRLEIRDLGRWRVERAPGPRGRGLQMIGKLTDGASVDTGELGTVIRLRKKLTS